MHVLAHFELGEIVLEAQRFSRAISMPPHEHPEAHLVMALEGAVENGWRKQTVVADASAVCFIPAGEVHTTRFREGLELFVVTLPVSWTERIRPLCPSVESPQIYPNGVPTWQALRLYQEFQRVDSATPLLVEGILLELFGQMAREATGSPESRSPRWLGTVRDFLHAHYSENLSLDQVAAVAGVHPAHLTRTFRQYFHCTPGDYMRRLRIHHACRLLAISELPLVQIALEVGFANQSHFSRVFKEEMGMTPAAYRKRRTQV